MADLWGVVIGGLLAVGGGAATQLLLHTLKSRDESKKLQQAKLEEVIALIPGRAVLSTDAP